MTLLFLMITVIFDAFRSLPGVDKDASKMTAFMIKTFFSIMMFYLLPLLLIGPWFAARIQNPVLNHTALRASTFVSNIRARDLLVIYVTNFVVIILTLGLFKLIADIRLAKCRLTHLTLQTQVNLDEYFSPEL